MGSGISGCERCSPCSRIAVYLHSASASRRLGNLPHVCCYLCLNSQKRPAWPVFQLGQPSTCDTGGDVLGCQHCMQRSTWRCSLLGCSSALLQHLTLSCGDIGSHIWHDCRMRCSLLAAALLAPALISTAFNTGTGKILGQPTWLDCCMQLLMDSHKCTC